jgi:flagellar biogenesis protein FliO
MFGGRFFGARMFGRRFFGKAGAPPTPGYYWGKYFGRRYFGARYFGQKGDSNPFVATQSAGLSIAGTIGLSSVTVQSTAAFNASVSSGLALTGSLTANATPQPIEGEAFIAGAPLEFAATGALSFSGVTVELGFTPTDGKFFGGRYFGSRYFGRRYWSAQNPVIFEATVTSGLTINGAVTCSAVPQQVLSAAISNTLAFSGSIGYGSPTIDFEEPRRRRSVTMAPARRRVYIVKIDDEEFTVGTKEEAEQLLAAAVEAAKEKAEGTAKRIEPLKGKAKRREVAKARQELKPPVIEAPPDLAAEVMQAQEQIAEAYQQALEVAKAIDRVRQEQDDEEVLLLL